MKSLPRLYEFRFEVYDKKESVGYEKERFIELEKESFLMLVTDEKDRESMIQAYTGIYTKNWSKFNVVVKSSWSYVNARYSPSVDVAYKKV